MKKSIKWKKRVLLVAFAGVISINFTNCKSKESTSEIVMTEEIINKENEQQNNVTIKVENIDGDWNDYQKLVIATYQVQGVDKNFALVTGLVETEENRSLYRCITIPEFYLEETYDKDTYTTSYRFIPEEGIRENFTQTTKITAVTTLDVNKEMISFNEIEKLEEEAEKEENEKLESNLGR